MHPCICMWRPEVNVECFSQFPSTIFFETRSLNEPEATWPAGSCFIHGFPSLFHGSAMTSFYVGAGNLNFGHLVYTISVLLRCLPGSLRRSFFLILPKLVSNP